MSANPSILILHASGTNRDGEAARACELAGGAPEIVHLNQLRRGERRLADYEMLLLPGGFSYGDALGAGVRWRSTCRSIFTTNSTPLSTAASRCWASATAFRRWSRPGCCQGRGSEGEGRRRAAIAVASD